MYLLFKICFLTDNNFNQNNANNTKALNDFKDIINISLAICNLVRSRSKAFLSL